MISNPFRKAELANSIGAVDGHLKQLAKQKQEIFLELVEFATKASNLSGKDFSDGIKLQIGILRKKVELESRYIRFVEHLYNKYIKAPASEQKDKIENLAIGSPYREIGILLYSISEFFETSRESLKHEGNILMHLERDLLKIADTTERSQEAIECFQKFSSNINEIHKEELALKADYILRVVKKIQLKLIGMQAAHPKAVASIAAILMGLIDSQVGSDLLSFIMHVATVYGGLYAATVLGAKLRKVNIEAEWKKNRELVRGVLGI